MNSNSRHILWLTENYPPSGGGMSQSCDRIVYGLRKQDFNIHIVHFTNRKEAFATDTVYHGTYTAIPLSGNEAHTANLCWNYIARMSYSFSKLVIFGGYLPVLAGPVYSKWMNLPLVTLLRGNDFDISIFSTRRKPLLDDALQASETVGCVTLDQIRKIKKLYPGLRPVYTPNGIEIREWRLLPSDESFAVAWRDQKLCGRFCLGLFGQAKEKKGLDVLMKIILQAGNSEKYFLLMTGDPDEKDRIILESSGIKFEILPFLDRSELVKYYAVCDAVVIPSHYEGMPNVMLEAGALGIPVIASATGGMKDILAGFDESLLFYPGDAAGLGSVLNAFINTGKEEKEGFRVKWKKYIEDNYNAENEMRSYLEIFNYEKDHNKTLV